MSEDEHGIVQVGSVHGNLPAVYASDPTAQAFATAIDGMLIPVDRTLDRLPDNFDAFATPTELLPYLVKVSQARVEPSWPERAVRAAIDLAAWLATHRGTPAALLREARVVYGWTLAITDPGGVRLPDDALAWPADGTLQVDLEPVASGWEPVAYDQGSLERLIAAHVPASAPRVLAPPPGQCALYEGPYSTGLALIVSRDIADLAASNFNNRTSSVWNRSQGILALYEDPGFGENGGRQIVPAQHAENVSESMNKRTSSVKFLTGVPTGSWGLLDADGNLLGVYDGDASNLETGVGASATSLINNTIYTIGAFGEQPDSSQIIYPGVTAALETGVALALRQVTVYIQVPNGAFCLYELPQQGGRRWILWTQPGENADLAAIGAANSVSSIYNRTAVTLDLRANDGASQFFYPSAFADVTSAGLAGQASVVAVLNGAPAGHYCLYAGPGTTGKQWVFTYAPGITIDLTDPRVAADDAVSTVENRTSATLELFKDVNGTGSGQLFYPNLTVGVTTPELVGLAKSVTAYNGAPTGYYCLYANADKTGNQWVFRDTAKTERLTDPTIGAGSAVSLVENNTTWTLALFKNDDGKTGESQFFYPGLTSAVTAPGLDNNAQSAIVYYGPPADHYCLYGGLPSKQWIFKATPNSEQDLIPVGAVNIVTQVQNNSGLTIELFQEINATGSYQLSYPGTNVSVQSALWERAKLVRCYSGPPADYFCLYDGTNQSGKQYVFRGVAGTWNATAPDQNWNDRISSVDNRTRYTIQLFEATGQGGRGELFYPDRRANVTTINNLASSVTCYNGPPDGYYCLYDGAGQAGNQYVLTSAIGDVNLDTIGASNKISSVRNLTRFTIQLWSANQIWQLCYPSLSANVQSNLNNLANRVAVHDGPPANYYCLYENSPTTGGRQWLFHDSQREVYLPDIGAFYISTVRNNTRYTLELSEEHKFEGRWSQMFYPDLTTPASGYYTQTERARLFVVDSANRSSLPYGYFCLFGESNFGGTQWVFESGSKVRLTDINAAKKVYSAANNSWGNIMLFSNVDWTGSNWAVGQGSWDPTLREYDSNMAGRAQSVWGE